MNSISNFRVNTTFQKIQNIKLAKQQCVNTDQEPSISFHGKNLKRKRAPKTFGEAIQKYLFKILKKFFNLYGGSL